MNGGADNVSWRVVWNTLLHLTHASLVRLPYIVIGLLVFLAFLVLARMVPRAIRYAGRRTALDEGLATLLGRLASFAVQIVGLFAAAVVVFPAFKPGDLVAGLGITSIAIGFAFKDILQNYFAGILLLWRRPFLVGDQIRTRDYEGTVEDINVRSTHLKTFDGERAVIPNSEVYANPVLVLTAFAKRRVRLTVPIGYADSIETARSAVFSALRNTQGVSSDPGPWVYVQDLNLAGVELTVYFWTGSDQANVLKVTDHAATAIKDAIERAGISQTPTTTVLLHDQTGSLRHDIHPAGDRPPHAPEPGGQRAPS